ncbi:membrane-spanning 4-domains subfamily A member 4D-like [Pseudophryne corroboree]|uniref:membrane-spanning 4-domains subfamily A member 4D-like n=1 Tax=Pseudophryne corroboree TaxID=495146 RepID=UPI003081C108
MNRMVIPAYQNVNPRSLECKVPPATETFTVPPELLQWNLAAVVPQNIDSSSSFFRTFVKGKPKALGIVLIVSAILQIALGIGLFFIPHFLSLYSGIPFWGSVFYIIAGSLTIAAQAKPSICLVKGSLSMNIISTMVTLVVLILSGIDLAVIDCGYFYSPNGRDNPYLYRRCQLQLIIGYVCHSLLLGVNLLLFCITISVSIFGCRSLSHVQTNVTQVFLIQNDSVVSMNPSTAQVVSQVPPPPKRIVQYVNAF